jgi:insulysin
MTSTIEPTTAGVQIPLEIPLSYINAKMEYEQFVLPNGIKTTIVRDPISEKSACALAVKTGAADDHPDYPGLAHFTEHMLFLGTEKFPSENHYKQYLTQNGGSSNAGTSMESTVYKFNVVSGAFRGAVEIFSEFFKAPLFNSNATAREVRAVDSEDSKNRIIDGRRSLQVLKALIQPSHRYSKFSTGNANTLTRGDPDGQAEMTREVMQQFYKKNYGKIVFDC